MTLPSLLLVAQVAALADWNCDGPYVPPSGYEQETAFAASLDGAVESARARLTQRLCQGAPCDDLASHVATWRSGHRGEESCAMAVVATDLIAEWRESLSTRGLHKKITAGIEPLVPKKRPDARRVLVIGDVTLPGELSSLAPWLRAQVVEGTAAITDIDVLAEQSKGADAVLTTGAVERREGHRTIIDVSLTITRADGTMKSFVLAIPRASVPYTAPRAEKTLALELVASCQVHVEAGRYRDVGCGAGPLTEGDRYRLKVTPSEPAFGYVLAYNSTGQFQMLFPLPNEDNALRGAVPTAFPPEDWLELDNVKDVTEHLLVVASRERLQQLELLRGVDLPPRNQDERPAATRAMLGSVTSRGFKRKTSAAVPAANETTSASTLVQQGPGVAAVELSVAHR
jgi:hypothetical protein